MSALSAARKLFQDFFRRAPKRGEIVKVRSGTFDAIRVGHVARIFYTVPGSKVMYEHKFGPLGRPSFYVRHDGRLVIITGGRFRFTGRGFLH